MLRRLAFTLCVALALMPMPWDRRPQPPIDRSQTLAATALPAAAPDAGAVRIAEVWRLDSSNRGFGGFSALHLIGPRSFMLVSDGGRYARFTLDAAGVTRDVAIGAMPGEAGVPRRRVWQDLESLTHDPDSGQFWAGFEQFHRIVRYDARLSRVTGVRRLAEPWRNNGGVEAMLRLADGRFVLLAESRGRWRGPGEASEALMFARDPVAHPGDAPVHFAVDAAGRGRVTGMAQLPDGRVLLLFRRLRLLTGWHTTIAVADPAQIRAGRLWRSRTIARLERPGISENFEAIAVEPSAGAGGDLAIWIVADDNQTDLQQSLLVRLVWREPAATPAFSRAAR